MEYIWISILICIYMSIWVWVGDNWCEVFWDKITFPKVWVTIHLIVLILGFVALFIISLIMFIQGRKWGING